MLSQFFRFFRPNLMNKYRFGYVWNFWTRDDSCDWPIRRQYKASAPLVSTRRNKFISIVWWWVGATVCLHSKPLEIHIGFSVEKPTDRKLSIIVRHLRKKKKLWKCCEIYKNSHKNVQNVKHWCFGRISTIHNLPAQDKGMLLFRAFAANINILLLQFLFTQPFKQWRVSVAIEKYEAINKSN